MSRLIDLTGKKYGRWLVIKRITVAGKQRVCWLSRCDCGAERTVQGNHLRSGASTSCGCYSNEKTSERSRTHGLTGNATYICWKTMWSRCRNHNRPDFKNYGARGITVCDRWKNFRLFLRDMGFRPANLTLERIDNNAGYSPSNCKWASRSEQNNNTRRVRHITFNGETLPPSAWDKRLGFPPRCISKRLRSGWPVERAITRPARAFYGERIRHD